MAIRVARSIGRAGEADRAAAVDLASHRDGAARQLRSLAAAMHDRGFLLRRVPTRVGRDQHAAVEQLDEAVTADDVEGLERQPAPGVIAVTAQADATGDVDNASDARWHRRSEIELLLKFRFHIDRLEHLDASEAEPLDRGAVPDALVFAFVVVLGHPAVEGRLSFLGGLE